MPPAAEYFLRSLPALALAGLVLIASGCGGVRGISGADPFVHLDSLARDGMNLTVELLVSNLNDQPLHLSGARLQARLDDKTLFMSQWPLDVEIAARGRERIRLEVTGGLAGLEALDELTGGARVSLPYRLDGELFHDRGRSTEVDRRGFLHRVPGQPGRYR